MTKIKLQREKCRQLKALLDICEPHEKPEIQSYRRNSLFRLAFLHYLRDLESATDGNFDLLVSRKIDAIQVLLNE